MEHLSSRFPLEAWVVDPQLASSHLFAVPDEGFAASQIVLVVDSLLVSGGIFRPLPHSFDRKDPAILIAHYLNLLDPEKRGFYPALRERELLPFFNGFVATSRFTKDQMVGLGIPEEAVRVVRPGLEPRYFAPIEVGSSCGIPKILTVSSIVPEKGLGRLLSALQEMEDLEWSWEIVGETSLNSKFHMELRDRIRTSRIAARVRIRGAVSRSEMLRKYNSCDIFVLPSFFESCSIAIMEAMSRGIPVLAFDVGGIPEIVSDSKTGFLIPRGNFKALSERLRELLTNSEMRAGMREFAKKASQGFPKWKKSAGEFAAFLTRVHAISY